MSEINAIKKLNNYYRLFLIDCGCNFGFYSFYTASLSKENEIISIEASKNTLEEFNNNLSINNFSNIKVFNKAVSDQNDKKMEFNESEKDWESSLISSEFSIRQKNIVDSITIDSILENKNMDDRLLILKIDVEGADLNVLDGAKNIIKKSEPFIIIEFSKYIFKNEKFNYDYLSNFLKINDYQVYSKNGHKSSVEDILKLLKNLDKVHNTIGNYYLISNNRKDLVKKIFN